MMMGGGMGYDMGGGKGGMGGGMGGGKGGMGGEACQFFARASACRPASRAA